MVFWDHSTQQGVPTQTSIPSPRFRNWLTFGPSSFPGADSRDLPLKVPGASVLALPRRERLDRDPTERNTKAALMGAGTAERQTEPDQGEPSNPQQPWGCQDPLGVKKPPSSPLSHQGTEQPLNSPLSHQGMVQWLLWVTDVIYLPVMCPICTLSGRKLLLSQFLWV